MAKIDFGLLDLVKITGQVIFIILLVIVGYQIIMAIIGGTWESEHIMLSALGIIMVGLFTITGFLITQGRALGRLEERSKNLGDSLARLGDDFKGHLKEGH